MSGLLKYFPPLVISTTLCGYPLISFFHLWFDADGRYISIFFRASTCLLAIILFTNSPWRKPDAPTLAIFIFSILYASRLFHDLSALKYSTDLTEYEYWAHLLSGLIPMFTILTVRVIPDFKLTGWLIYIISSLTSLAILLTNFDQIASLQIERFRLYGNERLNPITVGSVGVVTVLSSLGIFFASKSKLQKIFSAFALLSGSVVLILGASRGPFISLLICLFMLIWFGKGSALRNRNKLLMSLLLLLAGFAASKFAGDQLSFLAKSTSYVTGDSVEARLLLYRNGLQEFLDSPIFGSGFLDKTTNMYPHNFIIEAMISTGIFGTILILFVTLTALKTLLNIWNDSDFNLNLILLHFIICQLFSGAFYGSPHFWMALSVSILIHRINPANFQRAPRQ